MLNKNTILVLGFMIAVSLCIGLLINQYRRQPIPLKYQTKEERLADSVAKISQNEHGAPNDLTLDEFRAFVEERRGLVLDARPEIFHRLGHVPGALSLPREEFEKGYSSLKEKLELDKKQLIAVYCSSSSCEDSHLVGKSLAKLGYLNVSVFSGGWAAWTKAGLKEESSQ